MQNFNDTGVGNANVLNFHIDLSDLNDQLNNK